MLNDQSLLSTRRTRRQSKFNHWDNDSKEGGNVTKIRFWITNIHFFYDTDISRLRMFYSYFPKTHNPTHRIHIVFISVSFPFYLIVSVLFTPGFLLFCIWFWFVLHSALHPASVQFPYLLHTVSARSPCCFTTVRYP